MRCARDMDRAMGHVRRMEGLVASVESGTSPSSPGWVLVCYLIEDVACDSTARGVSAGMERQQGAGKCRCRMNGSIRTRYTCPSSTTSSKVPAPSLPSTIGTRTFLLLLTGCPTLVLGSLTAPASARAVFSK